MMLLKLVDELVISLMRIICTTDVDAGAVSYTHLDVYKRQKQKQVFDRIVSFHILTVHLLSYLARTVFCHVLCVKLVFRESSPFHLHRMNLQPHAHKK